MIRLHTPECDCPTCDRLNLGEFAYREIAAELGTDDPTVIDPIWRSRCEARIAALPAMLSSLALPSRHHAAA